LGVNLRALENSVKVRYGGDIDASAYLKKFVSFTLNLPEFADDHQSTKVIIKYAQTIAEKMELPKPAIEIIIDHLHAVSKSNDVSIRDVGRICSLVSLLPKEAMSENTLFGWREVAITLIISKTMRPDLYPKFLKASLSDADLQSYFGPLIEEENDDKIRKRSDPHYYKSAIRHQMWDYIRKNGNLGDANNEQSIGRAFDSFGRPDIVKELPEMIHKMWIDLFRLA
jgi:hypothetical protein